MKVLVAHNRYRQPGGEDAQFEREVALLRDRGHEVRTFEQANREVAADGLVSRGVLFANTVWSAGVYRAIRREIADFRPHVVHVHNFLPIISPAIYFAAWREQVPVVQTLHNYRLTCPAGVLYRDGRVCEDCVGRTSWRAVRHACYRGSRAASLAVSSMLEVHRALRTWKRVEAYIAVSEFVRDKLVASGLPPDRVHVKPNFTPDPGRVRTGPGDYALYVGRLSVEKGVLTLLQAWSSQAGLPRPPIPLKLAGDGPLMAELRHRVTASGAPVELLGRQTPEAVSELLGNARFLVCPSVCYETFGLSVIEAFAAGVPALATRIGGLIELVEEGKNGAYVQPGDAAGLAAAAAELAADPDRNARMGAAARRSFLAKYAPERNYEILCEIYGRARRSRRLGPDDRR